MPRGRLGAPASQPASQPHPAAREHGARAGRGRAPPAATRPGRAPRRAQLPARQTVSGGEGGAPWRPRSRHPAGSTHAPCSASPAATGRRRPAPAPQPRTVEAAPRQLRQLQERRARVQQQLDALPAQRGERLEARTDLPRRERAHSRVGPGPAAAGSAPCSAGTQRLAVSRLVRSEGPAAAGRALPAHWTQDAGREGEGALGGGRAAGAGGAPQEGPAAARRAPCRQTRNMRAAMLLLGCWVQSQLR